MYHDVNNFQHAVEKLDEVSRNLESLESAVVTELTNLVNELNQACVWARPAERVELRIILKDLKSLRDNVKEKGYY